MIKTNIKQMLTLNDFQNETWYHGTTLSLMGTSIDKFNVDTSYTRQTKGKDRRLTDFGRGFYLTSDIKQAERLAKMRLNSKYNMNQMYKQMGVPNVLSNKDRAVVIGYKIDFIKANTNFLKTDVAKHKGIKALTYNTFDKNYVDYTTVHRFSNKYGYEKKANELENRLDFVYGPVLDGKKGYMLYEGLLYFKQNKVTLEKLEDMLMYHSKEENQLCILRKRMVKYMKLESYKKI